MANQSAEATVDKQNFANNAFTDFAPLLTLFGDEVTKQYLATSMGVADAVMLCIAPIGIMTTLVSAIRVGGHRLMKSLVGRARDAPDDDEKEILSSTSPNVREIWSGNRVVRQIGVPKTTILAFDEESVETARTLMRLDKVEKAEGVKMIVLRDSRQLFEELEAAGGLKSKFRVIFDRNKRIGDGIELGKSDRSLKSLLSNKIPPNLTLNIQGAIPNRSKVIAFACVGFLVQSTVVIINALALYRWHWRRAGKIVMAYGYPTWAVGTGALSIGTFMCGWVVETSCRKVALLASKRNPQHKGLPRTRPLRYIFLQHRILEQNLPGYAIRSIPLGRPIQISRRIYPAAFEEASSTDQGLQNRKKPTKGTERRKWLTTLGAVLALSGFVCQNIGIRELHWSAGLLQLGVTMIMTLLRAWLRHRVGDLTEGSSQELDRKYPACDLAKKLTKSSCYLPILFGTFSYPIDIPDKIKSLGREAAPMSDIWSPHFKFAAESLEMSSESREKSLSTLLNIQISLDDYEPDVSESSNVATGCCKAMEEILRLLCGKITEDDLYDGYHLAKLGVFAHLILTRDLGSTIKAHHKAGQTKIYEGLTPFDLSDHHQLKDHIRFIQAIIKATRYAHFHPISKLNKWPPQTARIIGNCTFDDLEAYLKQLEAWLQRKKIYIRNTQLGSREQDDPDAHMFRPAYLVFGVPFSANFPKRSISAVETGKLSDPQDPCYFDLVVHGQKTDDFRILDRNIVLDLLSSFMLQATSKYRSKVMDLTATDLDKGCATLVDILLKHAVCNSELEARLAIIPALIQNGIIPLASKKDHRPQSSDPAREGSKTLDRQGQIPSDAPLRSSPSSDQLREEIRQLDEMIVQLEEE